MSYEVKLDVYEGPLDLLLHLITRQRVDIYDVSLASITDEYLAAVGDADVLDLEGATGFLVVAATLLELKSLRLLPRPDSDTPDGFLEERDLLLARLVECATYRDAGQWLALGLRAGEQRHPRLVALEPRFASLAPDVLGRVTVADLVTAGARALLRPPEPLLDTSHVTPITATVKDAIEHIAAVLTTVERASFRALTAGLDGRMDVIVHFLALLELFKAGAVDLDQGDRFGDIAVRWTAAGDVAHVLVEADDYAAQKEST